jgi:hypothetical protein
VQQWVHRRGLNDLERFQRQLVMREDPEAGDWLRQQWDEPLSAPTTPTHHASPDASPEALPIAEPVPAPEAAEAPSPATIPFPAVAEEKPLETASPHPPLTESFTEPLSEELRLLLATPLEDPFGKPAPRLALQMRETLFSSEETERSEDQAPLEGEEASPPPARRGTLSRIKARMRGYMEEAMDALHRTPPLADPPAAEPSEPPVREEKSAVAAPSPTTLADLRAWLPDAADDVPRAS